MDAVTEGAAIARSTSPVSAIEAIEKAMDEFDREVDDALSSESERADLWNDIDVSASDLREVLALARQAEALERENAELRKKLDACDWDWPEDDTSSDACSDGPWQIAEDCDLPPGEVLAYSRGGVVETRFYAYLPPADDSDSDDEFEVDAETELAVKQAIEAETARRARALMKGEDDAGN